MYHRYQTNITQQCARPIRIIWENLLLVFCLRSFNHGIVLPYSQALGIEHPTIRKKTNKSEGNQTMKWQKSILVCDNYRKRSSPNT